MHRGPTRPGPGAQQGLSLVIVLVLIAAMALVSVASLRASAGSAQLLRVRSLQALALEQAQWALQYCEAQLLLPSSTRDPRLADAALPLTTATATAWTVATHWQSGGASVNAPPMPGSPSGTSQASCLVERQRLGAGDVVIHLVTARGLSPDPLADVARGVRPMDAAMWLQSTVLIDAGELRARSLRRIVNPPKI